MSSDEHTHDESTDYDNRDRDRRPREDSAPRDEPAEPPREQRDDRDADVAKESDWGLEDTKVSDSPVENPIRIDGEWRTITVWEVAEADAPNLDDARTERARYRMIAKFFRENIVEPAEFQDVRADDIDEMRLGTAEKLLNAIIPETERQPGNGL